MKFAHIADCHLDSFREPELNSVVTKAFVSAVDKCIEEKVGFVIIAGDLFHSSSPDIQVLREATVKLRQLRDAGIPVYAIPGSHDFSHSGKTIISVLEAAGLMKMVSRGTEKEGKLSLGFVTDAGTGAVITGLPGRKGALEKKYYEMLDSETGNQAQAGAGPKIFVFHSAIEEFKPSFLKGVESLPLSLLPKGFDYYAGGHVHEKFVKEPDRAKGYGKIAYPGPLYPANFRELEDLKEGGFLMVECSRSAGAGSKGKSPDAGCSGWAMKETFIPIRPAEVLALRVDVNGKTFSAAENKMIEALQEENLKGKIVLLRVEGTLSEGRPTDISFRKVHEEAEKRNALVFKKNTEKLSSKEFAKIMVESGDGERGDLSALEEKIIREHAGDAKLLGLDKEGEARLTLEMMSRLDELRMEGETIDRFEGRISGLGAEAMRPCTEQDSGGDSGSGARAQKRRSAK